MEIIIIENEDGFTAYLSKFPNLTATGDTYEEAVENLEELIQSEMSQTLGEHYKDDLFEEISVKFYNFNRDELDVLSHFIPDKEDEDEDYGDDNLMI